MTIESCVVAMIIGGLIIAANGPLAKLLHLLYHKLLGIDYTKERLQRTQLVLIINGTVIMILYAWNLHSLLIAPSPGNGIQ